MVNNMKRKLIKRNKMKMTFCMKNKLLYILRRDPSYQYFRLSFKYNEAHVLERAYRRNKFSKMIHVPLEITSRNRRSRIRNKEIACCVFPNIDQFNERYELNMKLEDFPTKY